MAKKHTQYTTCVNCGAALDPGERCGCTSGSGETPRQSSFDDIEKDRRKAFVNELYDRYYGTSRRRKGA